MVGVSIYVDILNENKPGGITLDWCSVIYNIHALNAIRNRKIDGKIEISQESPLVQAGNFVCIKQLLPAGKMSLIFYDFKEDPELLEDAKKSLSSRDAFILDSIVNYINENYESVKKEIVLKKGRAVCEDSEIAIDITHPMILQHKQVVEATIKSINALFKDMKSDLIREAAVIEIRHDRESNNPEAMEIVVYCDDEILRLKALDMLKNQLYKG